MILFLTLAMALGACHFSGDLPDPACTPGDVATTDVTIICGTSTRERRHVSTATCRAVFAEYGIAYPPTLGAYEVDHLIPLELGGSNDLANLWPEPAPGYHVKDRLENELHREVCAGRLGVEDAQARMARDWTGKR